MSDGTMGELQLPCPVSPEKLVAAVTRVAEAASRVAAQHPGDGFAPLRQLRRRQVAKRMTALRTGQPYNS